MVVIYRFEDRTIYCFLYFMLHVQSLKKAALVQMCIVLYIVCGVFFVCKIWLIVIGLCAILLIFMILCDNIIVLCAPNKKIFVQFSNWKNKKCHHLQCHFVLILVSINRNESTTLTGIYATKLSVTFNFLRFS